MQTIISERCKICGKTLRTYNKKHTFFFGPQIKNCPCCNTIYFDPNAIELSTKPYDTVKRYCIEYMLEGQLFLCFALFMLVASLACSMKSENWVNQPSNFFFLFLVGFVLPYVLKCAIKFLYFWKIIYSKSCKRMDDKKYLAKIKLYNQQFQNPSD